MGFHCWVIIIMMKIINTEISLEEIKQMAQNKFGNFVKAVIDIDKNIMAVDAELHADEESLLIENGSKQQDLWGINIYPDLKEEDRIEFDSMINLRPFQGNRSRSVENPQVRGKIMKIVNGLIKT
jgi:hypothetical protein